MSKKRLSVMFLISALLGLLFCLFLLIRSTQVYNFRNNVIDICYDYNTSDISDKKIKDAWLVYHSLPSFDDMLWSFKPLKFETYIDKKIVNEINLPYEYNLENLK